MKYKVNDVSDKNHYEGATVYIIVENEEGKYNSIEMLYEDYDNELIKDDTIDTDELKDYFFRFEKWYDEVQPPATGQCVDAQECYYIVRDGENQWMACNLERYYGAIDGFRIFDVKSFSDEELEIMMFEGVGVEWFDDCEGDIEEALQILEDYEYHGISREKIINQMKAFFRP